VRRGGPSWALFAAVVGVLATAAGAEVLPTEAIRPIQAYASPETRVVAEAHAGDLRSLYEAIRHCAPDLDFQPRDGIGFRRPRGVTGAPPHLAVWVWLPAGGPPHGRDLPSRAASAFERYGRRLFARSVALGPVSSDARIGGYILVLTWIGPNQLDGRAVGESLVVYADKPATADFVSGALPATEFLARGRVRLFDGQTEVTLPNFAVAAGAPVPASAC
jgi:hypothetical protein